MEIEYQGIKITKKHAERQPEEDVQNEFNLIKRLIDRGSMGDTKEIKFIGGTHWTTDDGLNEPHITLKFEPGSSIVRLYLYPKEARVTSGTVVSRVVDTRIGLNSGDFWNDSPTCVEVKYPQIDITSEADVAGNKGHIYFRPHAHSQVCGGELWANDKTITYSFLDDNDTSHSQYQQMKVTAVIKEWEKYGNIKFVQDTKEPMIRITFDRTKCSWSHIGNPNPDIASGESTMNLGWVHGDSATISEDERGVILHEFGHALGLVHEHQSPTRGHKITLEEAAVIKLYTETQGWSEHDVKNQIIRAYNESEVSNYTKFDENSIMMYFMPGAMNERNHTILPKTQLSEWDKTFMAINYPSKSRTQFTEALDFAGVPLQQKAEMLRYYNAHDWTQIRVLFKAWRNEARVAPEKSTSDLHVDPAHAVVWPIRDICLAEETQHPSRSPRGAQRGVATVNEFLWLPGEEITYSFIQGSQVTEYQKRRVRETFHNYSKRANLSFKLIEHNLSAGPKNMAKIRIYFDPDPNADYSWSQIGKESDPTLGSFDHVQKDNPKAYTSLQFSHVVPKFPPVDQEGMVCEARALYHEIGHSLGLRHEHTSPFSKTKGDEPSTNISMATPFDDKSVMLYPNRRLAESSWWEYLNPKSTKYNFVPSAVDLAFLGVTYPFPPNHENDRFLKDLQDLGITTTEPYLKPRLTVFTDIQSDSRSAIKEIRKNLRRDLMAIERTKATRAAHSISRVSRQRGVANPTTTVTTGSFLDELMKQLSAFFRPTSGQLFALQFPGRFLQKDLYAWDTTKAGIYGQFVKPTVVNESEFRLVDQLYNVGTVIGAPSGLNLSIVYEQVINNLVPGIQQSQIDFSLQQGKIRQWLIKDVPTSGWVKDLISSQHTQATGGGSTRSAELGAAHSINPSLFSDTTAKPQFSVANKLSADDKVNRMELAAALMQEYLAAKQAWELERDEMMKNASGKDLDALSRRLAHITKIREQQLASKYGDAVVRGYSHAIRQYLGYMDIKTPAEALQDAKDALRESAVSSLDGSMKVYPVQMQPIDWFQSLSTSFTMEDLTTNPDLIFQQIDSKSKQLDALNSRLAVLQGKPKINIGKIQKDLDAAQTKYDDANAELTSTYSTNVISLARASINAKNEFVLSDFTSSANLAKITNVVFDNLENSMGKLTKASSDVKRHSRALTQLMAAKSLAEATDTKQEITETTSLINALNKDISELTARLQSLRYKDGAPTAVPSQDNSSPSKTSLDDIPLLKPDTSSGGSRWQDFSFSHEIDTKYSASSEKGTSSVSNTSVPLFFGSYQSESNSSSAFANKTDQSKSVKVEVGFRATLVTVDRGGWFQPQFFKQSAGFHHIDPNTTWSKWPKSITSVQELSGMGKMNQLDAEAACNELNKHLLPAFPTGFIICKDITIKIHLSLTDIRKSSSEMEAYAATSAGVLCFSTSSSSASKESDKAYGFKAVSDGAVIRIPGPQILGYILQFTDPDTTTIIPETLPSGFLISDKEYDSTFKTKAARSVINPGDLTQDPQVKAEDQVAKIKDELAKVRDELVKAEDNLAKAENQVVKTEVQVAKAKDELGKAEVELTKAKTEAANGNKVTKV